MVRSSSFFLSVLTTMLLLLPLLLLLLLHPAVVAAATTTLSCSSSASSLMHSGKVEDTITVNVEQGCAVVVLNNLRFNFLMITSATRDKITDVDFSLEHLRVNRFSSTIRYAGIWLRKPLFGGTFLFSNVRLNLTNGLSSGETMRGNLLEIGPGGGELSKPFFFSPSSFISSNIEADIALARGSSGNTVLVYMFSISAQIANVKTFSIKNVHVNFAAVGGASFYASLKHSVVAIFPYDGMTGTEVGFHNCGAVHIENTKSTAASVVWAGTLNFGAVAIIPAASGEAKTPAFENTGAVQMTNIQLELSTADGTKARAVRAVLLECHSSVAITNTGLVRLTNLGMKLDLTVRTVNTWTVKIGALRDVREVIVAVDADAAAAAAGGGGGGITSSSSSAALIEINIEPYGTSMNDLQATTDFRLVELGTLQSVGRVDVRDQVFKLRAPLMPPGKGIAVSLAEDYPLRVQLAKVVNKVSNSSMAMRNCHLLLDYISSPKVIVLSLFAIGNVQNAHNIFISDSSIARSSSSSSDSPILYEPYIHAQVLLFSGHTSNLHRTEVVRVLVDFQAERWSGGKQTELQPWNWSPLVTVLRATSSAIKNISSIVVRHSSVSVSFTQSVQRNYVMLIFLSTGIFDNSQMRGEQPSVINISHCTMTAHDSNRGDAKFAPWGDAGFRLGVTVTALHTLFTSTYLGIGAIILQDIHISASSGAGTRPWVSVVYLYQSATPAQRQNSFFVEQIVARNCSSTLECPGGAGCPDSMTNIVDLRSAVGLPKPEEICGPTRCVLDVKNISIEGCSVSSRQSKLATTQTGQSRRTDDAQIFLSMDLFIDTLTVKQNKVFCYGCSTMAAAMLPGAAAHVRIESNSIEGNNCPGGSCIIVSQRLNMAGQHGWKSLGGVSSSGVTWGSRSLSIARNTLRCETDAVAGGMLAWFYAESSSSRITLPEIISWPARVTSHSNVIRATLRQDGGQGGFFVISSHHLARFTSFNDTLLFFPSQRGRTVEDAQITTPFIYLGRSRIDEVVLSSPDRDALVAKGVSRRQMGYTGCTTINGKPVVMDGLAERAARHKPPTNPIVFQFSLVLGPSLDAPVINSVRGTCRHIPTLTEELTATGSLLPTLTLPPTQRTESDSATPLPTESVPVYPVKQRQVFAGSSATVDAVAIAAPLVATAAAAVVSSVGSAGAAAGQQVNALTSVARRPMPRGGVASAMLMKRMSAVSSMTDDCPIPLFDALTPLGSDSNMLGIQLGDGPLASWRGAVISSLLVILIVICITTVALLVVYAWKVRQHNNNNSSSNQQQGRRRENSTSSSSSNKKRNAKLRREAMAACRYPSCFGTAPQICAPGAGMAIGGLLYYKDEPGSSSFAALGIVLLVVAPAVAMEIICYITNRFCAPPKMQLEKQPPPYVHDAQSSPPPSCFKKYCLWPLERFYGFLLWSDEEYSSKSSFVQKFAFCVSDSYRPGGPVLMLACTDLLAAAVGSLISGISMACLTEGCCIGTAAGALAVALFHTALITTLHLRYGRKDVLFHWAETLLNLLGSYLSTICNILILAARAMGVRSEHGLLRGASILGDIGMSVGFAATFVTCIFPMLLLAYDAVVALLKRREEARRRERNAPLTEVEFYGSEEAAAAARRRNPREFERWKRRQQASAQQQESESEMVEELIEMSNRRRSSSFRNNGGGSSSSRPEASSSSPASLQLSFSPRSPTNSSMGLSPDSAGRSPFGSRLSPSGGGGGGGASQQQQQRQRGRTVASAAEGAERERQQGESLSGPLLPQIFSTPTLFSNSPSSLQNNRAFCYNVAQQVDNARSSHHQHRASQPSAAAAAAEGHRGRRSTLEEASLRHSHHRGSSSSPRRDHGDIHRSSAGSGQHRDRRNSTSHDRDQQRHRQQRLDEAENDEGDGYHHNHRRASSNRGHNSNNNHKNEEKYHSRARNNSTRR